MRALSLVLALVAVLIASNARGEPQQTDRGLTFEVWTPPSFARTDARFPLIVFSHGFGGCARQSTFLMQALADDGYLVVAPNHADARCNRAGLRERFRPEEPFRNADAWSDQTYRDRRDDVENLITFVLNHEPYASHIDRSRIGLAGHSLGGYTVLGLAGAWPSWKDARVKAVLALSPYATPYLAHGTLGAMLVPVMYQGGTLDLGITPAVAKEGGVYDRSSAPKYFVEFERAGHLAWTNLNPTFQREIDSYALAFFNKYLKGERTRLDAAPPQDLADYRAAQH
jgi:predicted dienelactone hydrolase